MAMVLMTPIEVQMEVQMTIEGTMEMAEEIVDKMEMGEEMVEEMVEETEVITVQMILVLVFQVDPTLATGLAKETEE